LWGSATLVNSVGPRLSSAWPWEPLIN